MPDLQYLADRLYEDNEIQYIYNESQKNASIQKEKITVTGKSIFTKLSDYPYEFEIDAELKLASIDGIKLGKETIEIDKEQYESMLQEIQMLKNNLEYKPGDVMTISGGAFLSGCMSDSKKQLWCTIFLDKAISKEVTKVTCSGGIFNIRHATGGYLFDSSYNTNKKFSDYFSVSSFSNNIINFKYQGTSALSGGTNNTPISVDLRW